MRTHSIDTSFDVIDEDDKEELDEVGDSPKCVPVRPDYPFWEDKVYSKSYFKNADINTRFKYYDSGGILNILFFNWVNRWAKLTSKKYVEPYKLHPLPVKDQILHWQPIFSKYVSDGLFRMEQHEAKKSNSEKDDKKDKPYLTVLLRALVYTFWKRIFFGLFLVLLVSGYSMSISILVNKFLSKILNNNIEFFYSIVFIVYISFFQLVDGFLYDHVMFYMYRLTYIMQYCFSITVFQHGLCYRRKFFNNVEGSNKLNVCNNVLHSCSPESECSKNPLYCPARRYQNKDITPKIFGYQFIDTYFISNFLESLAIVIQFLTTVIYGFLLIEYFIKIDVKYLFMLTSFFIIAILIFETLNTMVLKRIYAYKDYRIEKCRDILCSIFLTVKMSLDSIAHNIITEARNEELSFIIVRLLLSFSNRIFFTLVVCKVFLVILEDFVNKLENVKEIGDIDNVGLSSLLYVLMKVMFQTSLFPQAIKQMFTSVTSFFRIRKYVNSCSPNFYICDNKFKGKTEMFSSIDEVTKDLEKDVVVLYKDASFSWVDSKEDLLNSNYDIFLRNVNFQLKRGEIAIVTGSQGSGKSNFIKSILGEMTLVGGSMAVVPLYTSMPIFYASQDIWLQQGTIRSNITFGYKYDEECYNQVIKAVELVSDISTWERGDLRVVSDNCFSLSGGQRVRMEMARAIYAYMIFSKVNKEYNNGKCSFLMCLDSPFTGLDPYVCKTIFNNLFNLKTGILVKDDLSVVLSSLIRSLSKCVSSSDYEIFPNIRIYTISNQYFNFHHTLTEFIQNPTEFSEPAFKPISCLNTSECSLSEEEPDFVSTDDPEESTDLFKRAYGRSTITKAKGSFIVKKYLQSNYTVNSAIKFKAYKNYFRAVGSTFAIYIILSFTYTIVENVKFIFASDLSEYITNKFWSSKTPEEFIINYNEVKKYCRVSLNTITNFTLVVILVCLLSNILLALSCIISSRKIHEYCINSIFTNSSAVIKIKKQIGQMITYLSCDVFQIDESLGYAMSTTLISLIESIIHTLTLCYLLPFSTPVVVFLIVLMVRFVLMPYVRSSKNLQIASLESVSQINSLCENAISGSIIFRSFKKEREFVMGIIEHTDYYMRCLFLNKSILTRTTLLSKPLFFLINISMSIPLIRWKYFGSVLRYGLYGLSISMSMILSYTFTNFMISFGRLEILMCSMKRFENFVPPGTKCRFGKRKDTREEELIVNFSDGKFEEEMNISKQKLLKLRDQEYSKTTSCYSCKKLVSKPKIVELDVTKYIPQTHTGVKIENLYVSISESKDQNKYILANINATANASEIIGIIGRTGAGKTTLLSILQNTARNRTGSILLDGTDLNDIPKEVCRQIIGVLPQLPFVFKGWTVRRFLDPRRLFSDNEINEALDNCGLLEFVNNLPGNRGLDTVIMKEDFEFGKKRPKKVQKKNDRSSKYRKSLGYADLKDFYTDSEMIMSSNQLRTLSFAKLVLYRRFYRIILFDEPPSENCGDEDESASQEIGLPIYELLEKYFKHCTSFVTAHDANALVSCTSVWVLHNGYLIKTCKKEDIPANESISKIIEETIKSQELNLS